MLAYVHDGGVDPGRALRQIVLFQVLSPQFLGLLGALRLDVYREVQGDDTHDCICCFSCPL